MSEFQAENQEPKKQYDAVTGMMVTTEQSMKAAHDRALYEFKEWYNAKAAPQEGYGIDGRPLQRGKNRE